jgi:hypothetical protein
MHGSLRCRIGSCLGVCGKYINGFPFVDWLIIVHVKVGIIVWFRSGTLFQYEIQARLITNLIVPQCVFILQQGQSLGTRWRQWFGSRCIACGRVVRVSSMIQANLRHVRGSGRQRGSHHNFGAGPVAVSKRSHGRWMLLERRQNLVFDAADGVMLAIAQQSKGLVLSLHSDVTDNINSVQSHSTPKEE